MSKAYSKTRRAGATASDDALHEAAREAVKAAIDADHAPDPLFRPVVSRLVSAYTSAAKRHGPLIERAIGDALEAAGCAVFRNLGLPVPQGALELAESHENALTPKRQIRFVEGKSRASSMWTCSRSTKSHRLLKDRQRRDLGVADGKPLSRVKVARAPTGRLDADMRRWPSTLSQGISGGTLPLPIRTGFVPVLCRRSRIGAARRGAGFTSC